MTFFNKGSILGLAILLAAGTLQAQETLRVTEFGFSEGAAASKILITASGDSLFMNRAMNHQISNSPLFPHAVEVCTMTGLITSGNSDTVSCSCIRTDDDGDEIMGFCYPRNPDRTMPVIYTGGNGKYDGLTCKANFKPSESSSRGLAGTWVYDTEFTCSRE